MQSVAPSLSKKDLAGTSSISASEACKVANPESSKEGFTQTLNFKPTKQLKSQSVLMQGENCRMRHTGWKWMNLMTSWQSHEEGGGYYIGWCLSPGTKCITRRLLTATPRALHHRWPSLHGARHGFPHQLLVLLDGQLVIAWMLQPWHLAKQRNAERNRMK